MNVKNCRKCGRLFNYLTGMYICPNCKDDLEEKFQEVKEYIRENPRVSISEVCQECEVETGQIHQWLREERLELTEDSPIRMTCESCGDQIRGGKMCEKCKNDLAKGLNNAFVKEAPPKEETKPLRSSKENKMRFL